MDYKEIYKSRVMSAEEALKKIKPNSRVFFGMSMSEPDYLVDVMCNNKEWFENVEICHMGSTGPHRYCYEEGMEGHLHHNSLFVSAASKNSVRDGKSDFTPIFFSEMPRLIENGPIKADVCMLMVTTPDENGNVSIGLSCDYTRQALDTASLVIAQVNEYWPYTYGDTVVSVEAIDCFVEYSAPIREMPIAPITDKDREIGKHCAELINDGDTLQLGIGALPDAVCGFIEHKKNLGIHSEMISDGVVNLMKCGAVTNVNKKVDKGVTVASFAMGTTAFYEYIDHNPNFLFKRVDYTNDPFIVAKQDYMVSINSCVEVDLQGQVCSESVGLFQISAVGGQVDFVRGCSLAKHGRSIIATHSVTKNHKSKIVAFLEPGAAVTTSRNDVDYVVTEYGIAHLKGRSLRERAILLINIAHPDFRDELKKEFERRFKCEFPEELD